MSTTDRSGNSATFPYFKYTNIILAAAMAAIGLIMFWLDWGGLGSGNGKKLISYEMVLNL